MSIYQIATKYLAGEYADTHGLGIHDAVHVLSTRLQVSKPELRAAIYSLLEEDVTPVEYVGTENAAVEGGDIEPAVEDEADEF